MDEEIKNKFKEKGNNFRWFSVNDKSTDMVLRRRYH